MNFVPSKEEKIMNNAKKVSISVLVLLSMLLTGFTWSYWARDNKITVDNNSGENTIVLGAAKDEEVKTTLTVTLDGKSGVLVPAGRTDANNKEMTEKINQAVNVVWDVEKNSPAYGAETEVTVKHVGTKIDGVKGNANLIHLNFEGSNNATLTQTVLGDKTKAAVPFRYNVTMDEPANKEVYNQYAGKTVTLEFEVTAIVK